MRMRDLWLFDLDGTLVDIRDIQIATTLLDYQGIGLNPSRELVLDRFGYSEYMAHVHILKALGYEPNEGTIERLINGHTPNFVRVISPVEHIKPLKGAIGFIKYLQENDEYLGIVTGNLKTPAELILKKSGLKDSFPIVSCDDGNSDRKEIVQRAIEEARSKGYRYNKVVVIGDTTHDLEAGKAVNALVVLAATGTVKRKALEQRVSELDYKHSSIVVPTLSHYKKIYLRIKTI